MTKICCISDTHQKHEQLTLPESDILIHSGDFTNKGNYFAIRDFLSWFVKQPAKYKIFISGNHEIGLERGPTKEAKQDLIKSYVSVNENLYYLENSGISIEGMNIYGSPFTPYFYDWEWNVPRGAEIAKKWEAIPDSTNILITHGPPHSILDLIDSFSNERDIHQGCEELLKKVDSLPALKLHVFGHLHLQGCNQFILNNKIFVNAAMCDDKHKIRSNPIVVDM